MFFFYNIIIRVENKICVKIMKRDEGKKKKTITKEIRLHCFAANGDE